MSALILNLVTRTPLMTPSSRPHPQPIRNATMGGSAKFLAARPAMMPEKARMPPIERSNMPLIRSTIIPHARMAVCAVSSRMTAAFAARGKVVGSRTLIAAIRTAMSMISNSCRSVAMRTSRSLARDRSIAGLSIGALGATAALLPECGMSVLMLRFAQPRDGLLARRAPGWQSPLPSRHPARRPPGPPT